MYLFFSNARPDSKFFFQLPPSTQEVSSWGFKYGWRLCQPGCIRIKLTRWISQLGSSGALLSGKKSLWVHPLLLHLASSKPALAPKLAVLGIRGEEQKRQWPQRWSPPWSWNSKLLRSWNTQRNYHLHDLHHHTYEMNDIMIITGTTKRVCILIKHFPPSPSPEHRHVHSQ